MNLQRQGLRCAAAVVSGLTLAAAGLTGSVPATAQAAALTGSAPAIARTAASGPTVRLIAAQDEIRVPSSGGHVFFDPGIYAAALNSALIFRVQRASYAKPITISQVIRLRGGGTAIRRLPARMLDGFNGLRDFARLRVRNSRGKVVGAKQLGFCPNANPQRSSPASQVSSPYPQQCSAFDPFQQAIVWGLARGWAAEPEANPASEFGFGFGILQFKLKPGTYKITETITREYVRLFHITARDARVTITAKVTKQGSGPVPAPARRRNSPARGPLPSLPSVPYLRHPPRAVLPDLVPLPSFGIATANLRATKKKPAAAFLNFGATVSIGGSSPLDVEGFRSHGSPTMKAYQYFWRHGHIVGRARAGTMGFAKYNNWHFRQFAQYRLLDSARKLVLRSHKEGFCIAPTDPVNLLLPHAVWQPSSTGLSGECGDPAALWVQEMLPIGWADTYEQFVPGESFDITHLPNGTYYIEVIANPLKQLHESDTSNDVSLRKVVLGGKAGHRTVRVPAVHGIDPER
jgi:hypothetical protein